MQSLVPLTTVTQSRCCRLSVLFHVHFQTTVSCLKVKDGCLLCMAEMVGGIVGRLVTTVLSEGLLRPVLRRVILCLIVFSGLFQSNLVSDCIQLTVLDTVIWCLIVFS